MAARRKHNPLDTTSQADEIQVAGVVAVTRSQVRALQDQTPKETLVHQFLGWMLENELDMIQAFAQNHVRKSK
jgi:4-alpha-glucanotransferase